MENVEIPSGALIPRSALRMLYPHIGNTSNAAHLVGDSQTKAPSPKSVPRQSLEVHWNHIGVHAYMTPESSLKDRFVLALEKDPFVSDLRKENPLPAPWSLQDNGLLLHDNLVYVLQDAVLRVELMRMHHDDPLAGHYGEAKTLELLSRNYYFPGMRSFVKRYVSTCELCSRGKTPCHPKPGELASLPVPSGP